MKKFSYILAAFALPALASAQTLSGTSGVQGLITSVISFINNALVPLVFAIAFIVFIWGVFQYFIAGGADEEKRETGKSLMLWGIIGFFVMASVWGLVNIVRGSFSLTNTAGSLPDAPANNN